MSMLTCTSAPGVISFFDPKMLDLTLKKFYLLLWWRAKLASFTRSLSRTHGKGKHEFIVALLLVGLDLADKLVGKGNDGFHPVTQLTVAEILQQGAHLEEGQRPC